MLEHTPNPQSRSQARALAGFGLDEPMIAQSMMIELTTLRACYAAEMRGGRADAVANMLQALYKQGIAGDSLAAKTWLENFGGLF